MWSFLKSAAQRFFKFLSMLSSFVKGKSSKDSTESAETIHTDVESKMPANYPSDDNAQSSNKKLEEENEEFFDTLDEPYTQDNLNLDQNGVSQVKNGEDANNKELEEEEEEFFDALDEPYTQDNLNLDQNGVSQVKNGENAKTFLEDAYYSQSLNNGQFTLVDSLISAEKTLALAFYKVATSCEGTALKVPIGSTEHEKSYKVVGLEMGNTHVLNIQNNDSIVKFRATTNNTFIYLPSLLERRKKDNIGKIFECQRDEDKSTADVILFTDSSEINFNPNPKLNWLHKGILSPARKEAEKYMSEWSVDAMSVLPFCKVTCDSDKVNLKINHEHMTSKIYESVSGDSRAQKVADALGNENIKMVAKSLTNSKEDVSLPIKGLLIKGKILNMVIQRKNALADSGPDSMLNQSADASGLKNPKKTL